MTAPWECPHCEAMNNDTGREKQYCGACGRDREDIPEDKFDAWLRSIRPPNEPGGPL